MHLWYHKETKSARDFCVWIPNIDAVSIFASHLLFSSPEKKCQSVKRQTVKTSNCQSSKCQVSKRQVSKKTTLTVWQLQTVGQGWKSKEIRGFFRNYHIIPVSTVKVSTTVKMGVWQWIASKYAIFEQLSNCQGEVRIKSENRSDRCQCQTGKCQVSKKRLWQFDSCRR